MDSKLNNICSTKRITKLTVVVYNIVKITRIDPKNSLLNLALRFLFLMIEIVNIIMISNGKKTITAPKIAHAYSLRLQ